MLSIKRQAVGSSHHKSYAIFLFRIPMYKSSFILLFFVFVFVVVFHYVEPVHIPYHGAVSMHLVTKEIMRMILLLNFLLINITDVYLFINVLIVNT